MEKKQNPSRIILASQSPRRRELLAQMGLEFEIQPAQGEEIITASIPWQVVEELSRQKAEEVYARNQIKRQPFAQEAAGGCGQESVVPLLVIGADTVVTVDGRILGKPKQEAEACEMLRLLQGRTHEVYTGVTLIWDAVNAGMEGKAISLQHGQRTFYEETAVTFYPMTEEEIQTYVKTGDCMDKAGAYGIQSKAAIYIKEIQGDYHNVVGLPIARLYHELCACGMM